MTNYRLPDINKVLLVGRATSDTKLMLSKKETAFCMLTIANNRNYKDKDTGEWKKQTNFINVQITGKLAENVCDRIKKGTGLYIEGYISSYKRDINGKNITQTVVRAYNVKLLTLTEETPSGLEDEYTPPDISNGGELPPIGEEENEELPF